MKNRTSTKLFATMAASLVMIMSTTTTTVAQPPNSATKKASAVICQRLKKKADVQLCKELCTSWPLSKTCRVSLRFGSKGLQFVNKAQKDAKYQRNIERNAIKNFKFSQQEARRLRWYLTKHMRFFDPQDPTKSKRYVSFAQQKAILNQFDEVKRAKTLKQKSEAMKKAVQMGEYAYGKNDISMQRIYLAGALYAKLAGQMGLTRQYMKSSYDLASAKLPKDHPDRAEIELRYAKLLLELGDQRLGLMIMQNAFDRIEALYQGYDEANLNARRLLAKTLIRQGQYQSALPLFKNNIRDTIILHGPAHENIILAHLNLASVYRRNGDLIQARSAYNKAMALLKIKKLEKSKIAFRVWSGLGSLEMSAGHASTSLANDETKANNKKKASRHRDQAEEAYLLARQYYLKAQGILKSSTLLKSTHFKAELLHRLAETHNALNEPKKALVLHKEAMAINIKTHGKTSNEGIRSTRAVAMQMARLGQLQPAYTLMNELLLTSKSQSSNTQARTELSTAQLALLLGDQKRARALLLQAVERHHAHLLAHENITLDTTNMITQYSTRRPSLDWALSTLNRPEDEAKIWQLIVDWQGVITKQAMYREQEARFRAKVPTAHKTTYEQWRYHFMRGGQKSEQAQTLAKQLAKVPGFQALTTPTSSHTNTAKICEALKQQNANLLNISAIVKYSPHVAQEGKTLTLKSFDTTPHYWAHVVTPTCDMKRVDLGTKAALDALVATYRKTLKKAESCYAKRGAALCAKRLQRVSATSHALYQAIWAKAVGSDAKFTAAKHWYIVPDGKLTQVNFDGLVDAQNKYLIEHAAITLLPYPTALLHTTTETYTKGGALILGDINYKRAVSTKRAIGSLKQCAGTRCSTLPSKTQKTLIEAQQQGQLRAKKGCGYTSRWGTLRTEAPNVGAFLGKNLGASVFLATGDSATEAMLRQLAPTQRILHLATHGFFANTRACRDAMLRPILEKQLQVNQQVASPDLSMLTATILAGVNDRGNAPRANDGLLEGAEVSKLALDGTQLVVLSACETGLGIEIEGQGVLGLAQGYMLAGTQHIIASLWKVPSKPTTALFTDFYTHWLNPKKPQPITMALRQAKLDAIKRARAKGLADSSFLWSSFQLTTTRRSVKQ